MKSYTDDKMRLTVNAVGENRISQRKTADTNCANRETLQRHIKAAEKNEIIVRDARATDLSQRRNVISNDYAVGTRYDETTSSRSCVSIFGIQRSLN